MFDACGCNFRSFSCSAGTFSLSFFLSVQPCVPRTCSSCGRTWRACKTRTSPSSTRASTWAPTAPTLPHTRPPKSHLRSPTILCQMDRTPCTLQRETGELKTSSFTASDQEYSNNECYSMLWCFIAMVLLSWNFGPTSFGTLQTLGVRVLFRP